MASNKRLSDIFLSEGVLDILFYARENNRLEKEEQEEETNSNNQIKYDYDNIHKAIDNIPNGFVEVRDNIQYRLNVLIEDLKFEMSLQNQEYYSNGFYDGVNLIIECFMGNNKK